MGNLQRLNGHGIPNHGATLRAGPHRRHARCPALGIDLIPYMRRHHCGDWGDLDECDKQANEDALIHGDRILSHYKLGGGRRIYIITEWDRSSTCIMLPEEY